MSPRTLLAACFLLTVYPGCAAEDGGESTQDGNDMRTERGDGSDPGDACTAPAGDAVEPLRWFQVSCFDTEFSTADPQVATSRDEFDALFEAAGCEAPLATGIDFAVERAVLFTGLGRIQFVVETADAFVVAMETYRGPAPGSQGAPVAIVPGGSKPVVTQTCQGSTGCTPDGLCPP